MDLRGSTSKGRGRGKEKGKGMETKGEGRAASWPLGGMDAPGRDCPNIFGCSRLRVPGPSSGTGKATDFNFCRNIHRVDRNKRP